MDSGIVDHERKSMYEEQQIMEDLKLLTKRMHVKIKDVESNLDELMKKSNERKGMFACSKKKRE